MKLSGCLLGTIIKVNVFITCKCTIFFFAIQNVQTIWIVAENKWHNNNVWCEFCHESCAQERPNCMMALLHQRRVGEVEDGGWPADFAGGRLLEHLLLPCRWWKEAWTSLRWGKEGQGRRRKPGGAWMSVRRRGGNPDQEITFFTKLNSWTCYTAVFEPPTGTEYISLQHIYFANLELVLNKNLLFLGHISTENTQ